MKNKNFIFVLLLMLTLGIFGVYQNPAFSENEVSELKKQVADLEDRVRQLEEALINERTKAQDSSLPHARSGQDIFSEMERLQAEMQQMFHNRSSRQHSPLRQQPLRLNEEEMELEETEQEYKLSFNMSGLDKEKVDIKINEHSITLSGKYQEEHNQQNSGGIFHAQRFGSFYKTIPLPIDADTENIKTQKEGDTLVIKIPKKS